MSAMWVIILHMCTEFQVRRPSGSEDMDDFWSRN